MKIHLRKQTNYTTKIGAELNRLACVNNPFIKGYMLYLNDFIDLMHKDESKCCKKCIEIAKNLSK